MKAPSLPIKNFSAGALAFLAIFFNPVHADDQYNQLTSLDLTPQVWHIAMPITWGVHLIRHSVSMQILLFVK